MKGYLDQSAFELQFWLQILGDHSRFIHDSLAPSERSTIEKAMGFIKQFDDLLGRARQTEQQASWIDLAKQAQLAGKQLRELKLSIIKEHLVGNIKISLAPSFVNHMVNELDEALRVFSFLAKGEVPPQVHPLHHDLLWLLDAAGHAGAIHDELDLVEKKLKKQASHFSKDWEDFYLKAIELTGFLRTHLSEFPALTKFHHNVELEMVVFKHFLEELEEMELSKQSLGTLTPLMADHMAREECYYLIKLAETTEIQSPLCDPTKPRVSSKMK